MSEIHGVFLSFPEFCIQVLIDYVIKNHCGCFLRFSLTLMVCQHSLDIELFHSALKKFLLFFST